MENYHGKEGKGYIVNAKWREAALQRCSYKKVFWKYVANLQENSHAKVLFQ